MPEHHGAADGQRVDGHGLVVDELVVEGLSDAGIVVDEGVVLRLARAESRGAVGVDVDIVDVVDLQVVAVDIDVDGEASVVVGGVDHEGDVLQRCLVVAFFAEVVDEACALCRQLVLVVGVAGLQW